MRRLWFTLTVCSAIAFVAISALLAYTHYRCRTDTVYRPSVEFNAGGSEWCFYASPAGLGFRLMHRTEPKQCTGVMTADEWKAWSLKWMDDEPVYQAGGFSIMPRGRLTRTTHENGTFVGYDIGWWRAAFVPRWAAMAIPAILPLIGLARWLRRKRRETASGWPAEIQALKQAA